MELDLSPKQVAQLKYQELKLQTQKLKILEGLPHLFSWRWYRWARTFFESQHKITLLCSANQISKSSTQIRKCIEWATNQGLWPKLWKTRPQQFWYLYPSRDVATIEFEKKWVPEFMPRHEFKDHPTYGWKADYSQGEIHAIHFFSGVSVYFKVYTQDTQTLQASTAHAIFCFPGTTKIITDRGIRNLEDIQPGDRVLGREGFSVVENCISREAKVIKRRILEREIVSTPCHPFWTENRGWVDFSKLTEEDVLGTVPLWKQIEKLYSLKESYIGAIASILTHGLEITSRIISGINSTYRYGKAITKEMFPKITSFIIPTLIHSTTNSKISFALPGESTQAFINGTSGSLGATTSSIVSNVEVDSSLDPLRTKFLDIVLKSVENSLIGLERLAMLCAGFVTTRLKLSTRKTKSFAQTSVPIEPNIRVYNLRVRDSTYFANGILVHNCDEELPIELFPELQFRLAATDGYFSMVFTATLNQDFWRRAIERIGFEDEALPDALKLQVTMFDCLTYEDGTPGAYTEERIKRIMATCPTEIEVQRRVYGKFISESGRVISTFNPDRHLIKPFQIKEIHKIYSGVDVGSGGSTGHPAAITFLAIETDYRKGYVFRGWRGDNVMTSSSDIIEKWNELKQGLFPVLNSYDFASKDFHIVASRMGHPFIKADKQRKMGEDLLNTLFRNDMLFIFEEGELMKLSTELMSLMKNYNPISAKNNFYDSLRYAVMSAPWDFSHLVGSVDSNNTQKEIESRPLTAQELLDWEMDERWEALGKKRKTTTTDDAWRELDEEMDFWNEESGN